MEKPIVSIWGIGPSYRLRVKTHIEESINSGYDNIMDFFILTDDVSDFDELLKKTDKIKGIANIHEERKKSIWPQTEYIPNHLDAKQYGDEYRKNLHEDKMFSYSLHRYALPKIAELGYNKFVFLDGDVKIKYDKIGIEFSEEEFWKQFDTPSNSMKGCVKETLYIDRLTNKFTWAGAMGYDSSYSGLQSSSIVLNKLYETHGIKHRTPIVNNFEITEGPFRYYNFDSTEKLKKYFDIWDETTYYFFSNPHLKGCNQCGGYMLCDYLICGVTNIFNEMQVLNFPAQIYSRRVFFEDRYFLPPRPAGLPEHFEPGDNLDDFYEKNKELVSKIKNVNAWPHIEPL